MIIGGNLITFGPLQTWAMVGIIVVIARLWYVELTGKDKD